MLDDERDNPDLLMEDLKTGAATPGPRIQRLAQASALPATEVGLFVRRPTARTCARCAPCALGWATHAVCVGPRVSQLMQFEAMRESTRRIAAGEDPDEVNSSMAAPPGSNRQARRAAKKNAARAKKVKTKK